MLDYYIGTEFVPWNEWTDDDYEIIVEMTALNYAIEKENIEIIKLLLTNKKVDVNLFSKFSMESPEENYLLMTPLQAAIEKENIEIIKLLLLNDNIDPNVISVALSNNPDGNGKHIQRRERTALHMAVEYENIEIIKLLLNNDNIDVNINRTWFKYRDEHEEWSSEIKGYVKSALHIAIYNANVEIVKLLLNDIRTDVNLPQITFKSEIYIDDSDEWDSRRAPDEDPTFENSYLWSDIPNKWISSFDENKAQKTPLLFAIDFGNKEIVNLLVTHENVDVNLRNEFVQIKINKKEKINENKVEEQTALYHAIENGKTDLYNNAILVEILLKNNGIDINFPSIISNIPIQIDVDEEEEEEYNENEEEEEEEDDWEEKRKKKSKKNKTKVKVKPCNDDQDKVIEITPLQFAVEKGDKVIIELLENYK